MNEAVSNNRDVLTETVRVAAKGRPIGIVSCPASAAKPPAKIRLNCAAGARKLADVYTPPRSLFFLVWTFQAAVDLTYARRARI